jgi:NDP-sugar pyrophosphorylase family protein
MLMKAILICPDERSQVAALSEHVPLSNVPVLGRPLIEYWIEYLAARGAREILILASDQPEQVRAVVSDGARWGVTVTVLPELREITPEEALRKHRRGGGWMTRPDEVNVVDHFPGLSVLPLFDSYLSFLTAQPNLMTRAAGPTRIGLHEIQPGVWQGMHTRVAKGARLIAPCWIGDNVSIGEGAVIGPMAVVEHGSIVERGAEVVHSLVGPDTLIGQCAAIHYSVAWGNTLVDCRHNSCVHVSDSFLVSSLAGKPILFTEMLGRMAALFALVLTFPLAMFPLLRAMLQDRRSTRPRVGVRPQARGAGSGAIGTYRYFELTGIRGWLKRWPQLWSIVRGELAWVGNRPIEPSEAAQLTNPFEQLWLATRPGLVSLGDTEQVSRWFDDKARALASFYSVRASRRLDCMILARAVFLFVFGISWSRAKEFIHVARLPEEPERKESFT